MKKTKPTISIGIPAYNEEANINTLLTALLAQKEENYVLKEIILISDGSSDDTVKKARKIKNKKIVIIGDKKRLGKSARINTLFTLFKGDLLFLADADIVIKDQRMISKIIEKSDFSTSGIVSINVSPLPFQNFFENILETGFLVMKDIAKRWKNGNNYLSFKGCFLGMDTKLVRSINFPAHMVNNDAFLYFSALRKGYKPAYLKEAQVFYKSPSKFSDHVKQAARHQYSKQELEKYFNADLSSEYRIPLFISATSTLIYFFKRPVSLSAYLIVRMFAMLLSSKQQMKATWKIASSTKKISYE